VRRYAAPEVVNSRNPATRNGDKSSEDGDEKMDGGDGDSEGAFLSSSEEEDDA
jgi:hypothetical protein